MAEDQKSVDEEIQEEVRPEVEEAETVETTTEEIVEVDPLEELQAKYDELDDKFLRAEAEMQNMHGRFAKEQAATLKYASSKLAKSVLPALDNLERALAVEVEDEAAQQIKAGVEIVYNNLVSALAENDIKAVGVAGESFDPNVHQAIQSQPADDEHPADTIAQVFQKGYVLHDRVIRPAMVVVYN